MEPTSDSQSQDYGRTGVTDAAATHVCRVCHRPIPETADRRWRDSLVHRACHAELRCGVSLGGSGATRSRERDER